MCNDLGIAHVTGLSAWRTPGADLGDRSLRALQKVAAAAVDIEECRRLEVLAYEMAEAAQLAVPNVTTSSRMQEHAAARQK